MRRDFVGDDPPKLLQNKTFFCEVPPCLRWNDGGRVDGGRQEAKKKKKSLKWLEFLGVSFHSNNSGTLIKVRRAAAAARLFTGV